MDQAVHQNLRDTLAADNSVRMQAELRLRQLAREPEFPVSLARCTLTTECPLPQRQAAALALKHYIDRHWSEQAPRFEAPLTPAAAKQAVRQLAVEAYTVTEKKVRVAMAYVVSDMAQYDWPEEWPEFFDLHLHLLKNGSPEQVQAVMHVYSEFVKRDMTDQQLGQVVQLLPELYTLFANNQAHDLGTRARAVGVFKDCLEMFALLAFERPTVVDEYIRPALAQWETRMVEELRHPTIYRVSPDGPAPNLALKIEILKAVKLLLRFSPQRSTLVGGFLDLVAQELRALEPAYTHGFVATQEGSETWAYPSDVEGTGDLGLDTYLYALLDFLSETINRSPVRATFVATSTTSETGRLEPKPFLRDLIATVVPYLQISREQLEAWREDVDQFVADDDPDEALTFSVRVFAQDVLKALLDKFPAPTVTALGTVAPSFEARASQARATGDPQWWLPLEACLVAIGLAAEDMVEAYQSQATRHPTFDLAGLFEHVVLGMVQCPEPFARGRALVFTSRFCEILPAPVVGQYMEAAVATLEMPEPADDRETTLPVKMSALRALHYFCRTADAAVTRPFQPRLLRVIVALADHFTAETLLVGLETLYAALKLDDATAAEYEAMVGPFILSVWQEYPDHHLINSLTVDVLTVLAGNPGCYAAFQARLVPVISQTITDPAVEGGIVANALDLLSGLVRSGPSPLPTGYVEEVFPALVALMQRSDDPAILQNGQECFKYFVTKDFDHLAQWTDPNVSSTSSSSSSTSPPPPRTGLAILLDFVAHLLRAEASESAAFFVGDLIDALVQKGYPLLVPVGPQLVEALLQRLAAAKSAVFAQSLVLAVAHFVLADPAAALHWISIAQVPGGGLTVLVNRWCEEYDSFNGVYALKASAMALRKLLEHAEDAFDQITVKGDQIASHSGGIVTRSRSANAKVVKLFISDIQNNIDCMTAQRSGQLRGPMHQGVEDNDDWEDEEDEADLLAPAEDYEDLINLAHLADDDFDGGDEDDEDEDMKQSPIYQLNLKDFLVDFTKEFAAAKPTKFSAIANQYLTAKERAVAESIITS